MSYNKDYNNIIGQYDGSIISERTGLQIGQGLGIGTINLTNGSSTGTVNDVTITNTAGTNIGRNTNKFNISSSGNIAVIDNITGDIYNLSVNYVSSTSFTILSCGKLSYSLETHTPSATFSGPSGTYEYYIGFKTLVKNNSIAMTNTRNIDNLATGTNSILIGSGIASGGGSLAIMGGTASGGNSIAIGGLATAIGSDTISISSQYWVSDASGDQSLAINGTAVGDQSVAIQGGTSTGFFSLSIQGGEASGDASVAIQNGTASGLKSVAIQGGIASGINSIIIPGFYSLGTIYSQGQGSIVLGLSRNSGSILGVMSTADKYSSMLGGNDNYIGVNGNTTINSTYNATIIASQGSAIYQSSTVDTSLMIHTGIYGGNNNKIRSLANSSNLRTCNIIGAESSNITNNTGAQILNNCLLNTNNVTLSNTNNTTVIGQTSTVTITESDIVYVGKEIVGGYVATTVLSSALSNTSSTVYSNIISFNAKAGAVYRLILIGTYQTAATTTGIKVRMSGTAVANVTGYITGAITAATGATSLRATIASMTAELITTGVSAINTPHAIDGDIIVRCTTAGTVILQMASEVNASAAQLNIGTAVTVMRVI